MRSPLVGPRPNPHHYIRRFEAPPVDEREGHLRFGFTNVLGVGSEHPRRAGVVTPRLPHDSGSRDSRQQRNDQGEVCCYCPPRILGFAEKTMSPTASVSPRNPGIIKFRWDSSSGLTKHKSALTWRSKLQILRVQLGTL